MADTPLDVVIVGQGLAGTVLAWQLQEAGQKVLILDRQEVITSSKIAAGLITPITGQRLTLSWRVDEFLPFAHTFYRRIEKRTGRRFFHDRTAIRLFRSTKEQQVWQQRDKSTILDHLMAPPPSVLLDPQLGNSELGGFAMHAAQLDVATFLEVSRKLLPCQETAFDWQNDVSFNANGVEVLGHQARCLISCEGIAATQNPYFSWVPFNAAKGNILTVRFHGSMPPHCLHRGIWVAPTKEPDVFRIGSTYDWKKLDQQPDAGARKEIESKLKEFIHIPYTVLSQEAAVRPIIRESKPLIGLHPQHHQLGYFNGLGSKGSLLAPWFADYLTGLLVHQTPVPEDVNVQKAFAS